MTNPILLDFPEQIESARLIIRAPRAGDGPALNAAVCESLPELRRWLPWAQRAPSLDESEAGVRRGRARWILRDDLWLLLFLKNLDGVIESGKESEKESEKESGKESGKEGILVGASGIHRMDWTVRRFEIGYWLRTSLYGQGYMTEAVHAIAGFAFDILHARRVEIRADELNYRSWRVAERCGFELEGTLRNEVVDEVGNPRNLRIYAQVR